MFFVLADENGRYFEYEHDGNGSSGVVFGGDYRRALLFQTRIVDGHLRCFPYLPKLLADQHVQAVPVTVDIRLMEDPLELTANGRG